jgi:acetyl-CoA synthetase
MVLSSSAAWFPAKPGAIGKAAPGHDVGIVDDEGRVLPPNVEGDIAIRHPDPVTFLGYWNNPAATAEKYRGKWLITGDRGTVDEEGYFHFKGRLDDVITSAGYRIGPSEIEDCLLQHPAVASAGVVGVPDAWRTEVVTAFVVLRAGFEAGSSLVAELQSRVRERLGAHQYPRRVIFLNRLPMTITGEILRRELRSMAKGS